MMPIRCSFASARLRIFARHGLAGPNAIGPDKAARVHHAARRRGSLAARGASAAAGACSSCRRAIRRRRDGIVTGLAHRLLASARRLRLAREWQPRYARAMVERSAGMRVWAAELVARSPDVA